jgi:hypothetical protein
MDVETKSINFQKSTMSDLVRYQINQTFLKLESTSVKTYIYKKKGSCGSLEDNNHPHH